MILIRHIKYIIFFCALNFMAPLGEPCFARKDNGHAERARSRYLTDLVGCATVESREEKLACYEKHVAVLDKAESDGEIILIDRDQTNQARRGIFGLSLPSLSGIFGGDKEGAAHGRGKIDRLEAKIDRAYEQDNGRWVLILEDGAKWIQTDSEQIAIPPKAGQSILIRKAAMGSYFANVSGQRAIRVHREN